jgi:hypothetical protein
LRQSCTRIAPPNCAAHHRVESRVEHLPDEDLLDEAHPQEGARRVPKVLPRRVAELGDVPRLLGQQRRRLNRRCGDAMLLAERLHLGVERADEVEPLAERAHVVDPVEEEVGHRVRAEREHHRRHAVGAPPQLLCRPVEPQLRELHAAGASGRRRRARRRRRRRAGELRGGCDRRQRDDRVVVVAQVENRRSRLCRRATAAVAADAGHRAHDGVRAEQERDGHDAERAARHHRD